MGCVIGWVETVRFLPIHYDEKNTNSFASRLVYKKQVDHKEGWMDVAFQR